MYLFKTFVQCFAFISVALLPHTLIAQPQKTQPFPDFNAAALGGGLPTFSAAGPDYRQYNELVFTTRDFNKDPALFSEASSHGKNPALLSYYATEAPVHPRDKLKSKL